MTSADGLARVDPAVHDFVPVLLAGRGTAPVPRLLRGRDGLLWVAAGQHLSSLDPRDEGLAREQRFRVPTQPPPGSEWYVESLAEDAGGNLWVDTGA